MTHPSWNTGLLSVEAPLATAVVSEGEVRGLVHHSLLMDLAYDEFMRLREAGEPIDLEAFAQRYPDLRHSLWKMVEAQDYSEKNPYLFDPLDESLWPHVGDEFMGYYLEAELGRGGVARVFRARERAVGDRPVVVKVAEKSAAEAATLGRLRHDNIVPVLSVQLHPTNKRTAICMPYQGTVALDRVLSRFPKPVPRQARYLLDIAHDDRHPLPDAPPPHPRLLRGGYIEAVAHLGAQIADALAKVHALGMLHCDLKPSNVLLSPDARPLLLDFNLAFDPNRPAEIHGGTPAYTSPEQLATIAPEPCSNPRAFAPAPPVEARSDLYSLGMILFELLTGEHPFGKVPVPWPAAIAYMRDAHRRGPKSLRPLNPRVGRALARLIESCLAPDLDGRPASAAVMAAGLRQAVTPWPVRTWRSSRRAVLAAAVVLAVSGAGAAVQHAIMQPSAVQQEMQDGERHYRAGQYPDAIACFTKAIEADPENRAYLLARGFAHFKHREWLKAIKDLDGGDPEHNNPQACACRGFYLALSQDYPAAINENLKAARTLSSAEVWNNLAYSYLMVPVEGTAKERLQRAKERLLKMESNYLEAERSLQEALALDGNLRAAHYNRAVLDLRKRQLPQNQHYCPKAGVAEIQWVLTSGQESANEYYQAAFLCAWAAETCEATERDHFGKLVRDYAIEAMRQGYDRYTLEHDPLMRKWLSKLPDIEVAPNRVSDGREIPLFLADPLHD